jgi:hypothetical protein
MNINNKKIYYFLAWLVLEFKVRSSSGDQHILISGCR